MPFGSITLVPGVNVERTPTLLRAGVSVSSLIRYRDSLVQKLGGWDRYYGFQLSGTIKDLHGWQDLSSDKHLAVGATTQLSVITDGVLLNVTPQQLTSDFAPNFSTTMNSTTVGVDDPNISNVTTYDAVFFNVPISIGGLVLDGLYQISSITGTTSYTIEATTNATADSTSAEVPVFETATGSSLILVHFTDHNITSPGGSVYLPVATTGNGVTIFGHYVVITVVDADTFTIQANTAASASGSFSMNGGNAELVYNIALGPSQPGVGYGLGDYGSGAYGFGTGSSSSQTGTPISATDWTLDNWGELLMACPENGGIYQYDPTGGFVNASIISTAPPFNAGMFVSTTQQILVAFGSSIRGSLGYVQQPLLVQWSDLGNFAEWRPTAATQAGNDTLSQGSRIVAGMAVTTQNLLWTDTDVWSMNYQGTPFVFGFTMIGAGAGAVSSHSVQKLRGSVVWMGPSNFYSYSGSGVSVIPCPVWDAVFQNINTDFLRNVRAMPNTPFNEAGWLYPSAASMSGACDSYVKFNITEQGTPWDYGPMDRTAWIDQSVLGPPIGASSQGFIYQHETSPNADGLPLTSSFTTGYFYLAEGEEFAFVDQVIPDFKWGTFSGSPNAQIQITFNVVDFPGDTPRTYGPYTVTQAVQYISVRFRGRLMSVTVASADLDSFWRIGSIKYRYAPAGRR